MYGLNGNGRLPLLFTTTALLLVSSSGVYARAIPASSSFTVAEIVTYGAYVTLDLGQGSDLTLRLDLSDTDRVCSPSVPSIYQQSLPFDIKNGLGRGQLLLSDESNSQGSSSVQARWARECILSEGKRGEAEAVEVAQRLEVIIESIDGRILVPEVSFVAFLESPDADQSVVSYSLRLESEDFARRPRTYVSSSSFSSQSSSSSSSPPDGIVYDMGEVATLPSSIWKCRGFRCVLDSLRNRIDQLREDFHAWRRPQQHDLQGETREQESLKSYASSYDDTELEEDLLALVDAQEAEAEDDSGSDTPTPSSTQQQQNATPDKASESDRLLGTMTATQQQDAIPDKASESHRLLGTVIATPYHTPFAIPSLPKPDQSLVMTLAFAAAAFTIFSFSSICLLRMRYTPEIERRPRHRETREERLAELQMRREAAKNFFRRLFCGLFAFSEKPEGSYVGPQGRDLRAEAVAAVNRADGTTTPTSTTMEQELAGFREAASMVSNLIAAEEGRQRGMQQRSQPEPIVASPPVPISTRSMYHMYDYGSDVESLPPSYEFDSAETSIVSDGFRYSPGQFEFQYSPSSSPGAGTQGNGGSDHLGYGNKD